MPRSQSDIDADDALFRKKIFLAMLIPGILVSLMWLVKITEVLMEINLSDLGIYPLTFRGLGGIIFSPFIHADFNHLFNNTLPLFFLGTALFYFYSDVAFRVLAWTYIFTGLFVWLAGREAWHIGASGLVYGLASFLFFSGILRRHLRLIALSLLIVFLYGSMVGASSRMCIKMCHGSRICWVFSPELYLLSGTGIRAPSALYMSGWKRRMKRIRPQQLKMMKTQLIQYRKTEDIFMRCWQNHPNYYL
jgi:membrane associated rhomboid family serine protease